MQTHSLTRAERWSLAVLFGFTLVAVLGYAIFALHPERIPSDPFSQRFFSYSYPWFARIQILLSAVVLAISFVQRVGFRWIVAFLAVFGLSFLAEHVGTGTGFPFSGYAYTGLLGPRIGDRVPWVIPVSWFLMSAPAWVMARVSFPERSAGGTLFRILFATWLLVLWDLALDPAMSFLTTYWVWEERGAYYGMPWVNLAGWFGTGIVLMVTLEWLDRKIDWAAGVLPSWAVRYYLAVLLMPLGMLIGYGAWTGVVVTLAALASAWGIHLFAVSRSAAPGGAAPATASSGESA